jgi:hypothetical protein
MDSTRKPASHESIPPELWLSIFRLAAAEPREIFDTSPIDALWAGTRAWRNSWKSDDKYRRRKRTRTSLVLVSKYWRTLATEILYEFVLLTEHEMFSSFSRTLEGDWQDAQITAHTDCRSSEGSTRHVGQLIRYLRLDFFYAELSMLSNTEVGRIMSSFRLCPAGEVVFISYIIADVQISAAPSVLGALVNAGAPLRYVHGGSSHSIPPFLRIPSDNHIEVLSLMTQDHEWSSVTPLLLPYLYTLIIRPTDDDYAFVQWIIRCDLPLLTTVTLGSRWIASKIDNLLYLFFERHGGSITMLDVSAEYACDLSMILPHCPSIESIMIPVQHAQSLQPVLAKLRFIGLDLPERILNDEDIDQLSRAMEIISEEHGGRLQALGAGEGDG